MYTDGSTFNPRIEAIEKKQAERFPMLVEKLDKLEKRISYLERAERRSRYIKK